MNFRFIGNFLGTKTLFLLFITLILISCSLDIGKLSAKNQKSFYKIDDRDDIVGLVIYGDKIIAKGFSSQKIQNEIYFLDINNDTKIEILPLEYINKLSEDIDIEYNTDINPEINETEEIP